MSAHHDRIVRMSVLGSAQDVDGGFDGLRVDSLESELDSVLVLEQSVAKRVGDGQYRDRDQRVALLPS